MAVFKVSFESAANAPVVVGGGQGIVSSSTAGWVLRILKPTISIESPVISTITLAPWGEVLESDRRIFFAFSGFLVFLAGYGFLKLIRGR